MIIELLCFIKLYRIFESLKNLKSTGELQHAEKNENV